MYNIIPFGDAVPSLDPEPWVLYIRGLALVLFQSGCVQGSGNVPMKIPVLPVRPWDPLHGPRPLVFTLKCDHAKLGTPRPEGWLLVEDVNGT